MYGTVFRYRLKEGKEREFRQIFEEFIANPPADWLGAVTYQLDSDRNEYITAAVHADKEAYQANANRPEQAEWFGRFRQLLEADPDWNDGEVVFGWDR